MRNHGTHACYVHGPNTGSRPGGCRCEPCKAANRAYEQQRARRLEPPYVSATGTRAHVRELMDAGVGLKTIAKRSGVSVSTVGKLIYGAPARGQAPTKRIRPATRDRLLAVKHSDQADGAKIPAGPTWEVVRTLLDRGWTKAAIARAIGQRGPGLQLGPTEITARNARAIKALLAEPIPPRNYRGRLIEQPQIDHDAERRERLRRLAEAEARAFYRAQARADEADDQPEPIDYELPRLDAGPGAWIARAQCRRAGVAPNLFFPERGDRETQNAALAICATCSVRDECLTYALDHGEPGVWGGTTALQRDYMTGRRKLGATA